MCRRLVEDRAPARRRGAPEPERGADAGRRRVASPPLRRACRGRAGGSRPTRRAVRAARTAMSSASVAPGRARRRFSRIVELKTCAPWPARANVGRTSSCRISRMSQPPIVTRPDAGSRKRKRRFVTVVLPAPLSPTSATRRPGAITRSNASSTGGSVRRVACRHRLEGHDRRGARPRARRWRIGDQGWWSISSRTRRPAAVVAVSSCAAPGSGPTPSNEARREQRRRSPRGRGRDHRRRVPTPLRRGHRQSSARRRARVAPSRALRRGSRDAHPVRVARSAARTASRRSSSRP